MTAALGPTSTWHHDDDMRVLGRPYPTRNYAPHIQGDTDACLILPAPQLDYLRAIHEAGHAVAVLTGRGHLHSAQIVTGQATTEEGGVTRACHMNDGHAYAIFSAAGERAADRWLRESGLWTPERAVANEVAAHGDRRSFLAINPHVGFGDKEVDYRHVHDLADQALDTHWTAITAVADVLAARLYLTGDEIADLAQMSNGTHSHTCNPAA